MNQILDMIFLLSKKKKLLVKEEIEEIVYILLYDNDLIEYCHCIEEKSIDLFGYRYVSLFSYNHIEYKLSIAYSYLYYFLNLAYDLDTLDSFENYFYANIEILKNVVHEIEHIKQNKYVAKSKDCFDKKLLTLSFSRKKMSLFSVIFNSKLYTCCPAERMANASENEFVCTNYDFIESISKEVALAEKRYVYVNMLNGYEENIFGGVSIPLVKYLNSYGQSHILENEDCFDKNKKVFLDKCSYAYSFEDRNMYGLPISKEEHELLKNGLILTMK